MRVGILLAMWVLGCGSPQEVMTGRPETRPVEIAEAAAPTSCDEVSAEQLIAVLGDDAPSPRPTDAPRAVRTELTGTECAEAVLVVRAAGDTFEEHRYLQEEDGATDHLWVFRWAENGWAPVGSATFNASLDSGTLDYSPGVTAIRTLALGAHGGLLVVTTEQAQGSVDPRWSRIREHFFVIAEAELREALACNVAESVMGGPCRSGTHTERELSVRAGDVPMLHVRRTGYTDIDDEEECAVDSDIEPERNGDYRLVAGRFEPIGPDLCR